LQRTQTIRVVVDDRPFLTFEAVPIPAPSGELTFAASQAADPNILVVIAEIRAAKKRIQFDVQNHTYAIDAANSGELMQQFAAACKLPLAGE